MKLISLLLLVCFTHASYSKDPKRLRATLDDNASAENMRSAIMRQLAMSPEDLPNDSTFQEVSISLPIQFEFGSAELTNEGAEILSKAAQAMNSPELVMLNFIIEGHTDSIGSKEYNLVLSEKRAQSAKNQLILRGVKSDRLVALGYGEQKPIESVDKIDPSQRRVEIVTRKNNHE
ncbi:MAG: OmpA family protein [Marinicella sp.]